MEFFENLTAKKDNGKHENKIKRKMMVNMKTILNGSMDEYGWIMWPMNYDKHENMYHVLNIG